MPAWTCVAAAMFVASLGACSATRLSPATEHLAGPQWWTRYQPVTYNISSRSGTEAEFISMVKRCRAVGVGVYADVVINHMAAREGVSFLGTPFSNRRFPIYDENDFHHHTGDPSTNCDVHNYDNKTNVQYCDLDDCPDLCTACPSVRKTVAAYINHLQSLGVEGIRVDAAKHQDADELRGLFEYVNSDVYSYLEIIEAPGEAVSAEMYAPDMGDITQFAYAQKVSPIINGKGAMSDLVSVDQFVSNPAMLDSGTAVVFLDNHDTQRGGAKLTFRGGRAYSLANVFMLAYPYGYPMLMSSYYFNNFNDGPPNFPVYGEGTIDRCGDGTTWVCEHRWLYASNMVAFRNIVAGTNMTSYQGDGDDHLAFCRGSNGCVMLNRNHTVPWRAVLLLTLPPGVYCDVLQSDMPSMCPYVTVDASGVARVVVPPMSAVALHIGATSATPSCLVWRSFFKVPGRSLEVLTLLISLLCAGLGVSSPAVRNLMKKCLCRASSCFKLRSSGKSSVDCKDKCSGKAVPLLA
eukprot:TRINITY_DN5268_c1_g1_i4.p1 TRINITY_DN5268_c1_g1~~TRINITY_DN5268_c1_g1_i4.p1  ORF type:complete len:531 (-),score=72.77 TRINITY_DN5268_c1_g1_i4:63-1619(-)